MQDAEWLRRRPALARGGGLPRLPRGWTPQGSILSTGGIHSLGCRSIEPIGTEAGWLSERVLFRIVRGDEKGRPFGTPRNPRTPTQEEFNPQFGELVAGHIGARIAGRRHGLSPEQVQWVRQLSNEELVRFRPEDPISGHAGSGCFSITGGHHRLAEMIRRVESGKLPADTPIRILFHD
jgi:hypothetical protein